MTQVTTQAERATLLFLQEPKSERALLQATTYIEDNSMGTFIIQRYDREALATCVLMQDHSLLHTRVHPSDSAIAPLHDPKAVANAKLILLAPEYNERDPHEPPPADQSQADRAARLARAMEDSKSRKTQRACERYLDKHAHACMTAETSSVSPWKLRKTEYTVMRDSSVFAVHETSVPLTYANGSVSQMTIDPEGNPVPEHIATWRSPPLETIKTDLTAAVAAMVEAALP